MRGVAAICVVFVHEAGLMLPFQVRSGALAVDFFFVLSGFVLTAAYSGRLDGGMTIRSFMVTRYLRFLPLSVLGILLGSALTAALIHFQKSTMEPAEYGLALVTGMLMLPYPLPNYGLYPLDGPLWSLFIELIANFFFVAMWRRLSLRVLIVACACGFLPLVGWSLAHDGINAGYAWDNFLGGLIRVAFSFSAGVLIFRAGRPRFRLPTWTAPTLFLILAAALANRVGPAWLYDAVCVGVGFPAIVWLGSAVEWNPMGISTFLGRISFPLYAIHVPVFALISGGIAIALGHSVSLTGAPWSGLALLAVTMLAAYGIDRWYDVPARRFLAMRYRSLKPVLAQSGSAEA